MRFAARARPRPNLGAVHVAVSRSSDTATPGPHSRRSMTWSRAVEHAKVATTAAQASSSTAALARRSSSRTHATRFLSKTLSRCFSRSSRSRRTRRRRDRSRLRASAASSARDGSRRTICSFSDAQPAHLAGATIRSRNVPPGRRTRSDTSKLVHAGASPTSAPSRDDVARIMAPPGRTTRYRRGRPRTTWRTTTQTASRAPPRSRSEIQPRSKAAAPRPASGTGNRTR
mmetsp:Transcript_18980/g.65863  ORF Transcript_18980/g.65863 Transcript_18980/m.65863 type:complete len:229 (-) Transcript_18980:202-888(-)